MDDRGLNDAAILLVSLGEEEAAEVFKHLTPKEVQKLGETIARTRVIPRDRVDAVLTKFTAEAASQSLLVQDSGDYVRSVLKRALGDDKATLLIDRILQAPPYNAAIDCYSQAPVGKFELLAALGETFGLQHSVVGDQVRVNATGPKAHYYSLNRKAEQLFGYMPGDSSLSGVVREIRQQLDARH